MWQKVELGEESQKENEQAREALIKLGGVMATVETMPEPPKKERKPRGRSNTIIPSDPVNHPSHYTTGGIETIDFIEAKGLDYNLGNVVKYITRHKDKGHVDDVRKAIHYCQLILQLQYKLKGETHET